MSDTPLREQVLRDYDRLEPGEADAWNPVGDKWQLGYRLNLFWALTRALERSDLALRDLRVLDLGCGNGRSTRMYLDLGLRPDQLLGLDLRAGTLELARKLNPAIDWQLHDGGTLPRGRNWLSATKVFSSIADPKVRRDVARRIADAVGAGGYLFYYDARRALDWTGADPIDPAGLFDDFGVVWRRQIGRYDALPGRDLLEGLRRHGLRGTDAVPSLRDLARERLKPSDEALLLRKR